LAAKEKADHYTIIYGKDFLKELKYRVEDVIRELKKESHKKTPKSRHKINILQEGGSLQGTNQGLQDSLRNR
jgi:hypothetical protein